MSKARNAVIGIKNRWAKRRVELYVDRGHCANLFIGPLFLLSIGVDLEYKSAYISIARDKRYSLQLWPPIRLDVWE